MMRQLTEEERKLTRELEDLNLSEEEAEVKRKRLIEIDNEQTKDYPFCH